MLHPTEDSLWLAFREGSESAFDLIYGKQFPVLFNYGYRLCQDEELVKDCIQNLFVEIWQKRHQIKKVYSLKHYFIKIMRRKVFKELKIRQKTDTEQFSLEINEYRLDCLISCLSEQNLENEISVVTSRRLQCAVANLSARKKEAILLKFYENLTYAEISEVMDLRETKYARQLVYRALDELKKYITVIEENKRVGSVDAVFMLLLLLPSFSQVGSSIIL